MKKKIVITLIIITTIMLCWTLTIFAGTEAQLAKVDAGGNKILTIIRRIGYWLILVKAITDVVKAGLAGDKDAIGKIVFTYVLIYGALFFIPWALRLVEGIF